ncbi:MAG: hypothetical protein HY288_10605 [Planctomycetia bacterium]|nr:hypothetical protein [Planctomycetia bacterium]
MVADGVIRGERFQTGVVEAQRGLPMRMNEAAQGDAILVSRNRIARKQTAIWLLTSLLLAAGAFVGLLLWGYAQFGDPAAGIEFLGGQRVFLTPAKADIGGGRLGERRNVKLSVSNWSASSLTVVGGTSSCACSAIEGLPLVVPAGDVRSLNATVGFVGKSPVFSYILTLYTDASGAQSLSATISGRVLPASSPDPRISKPDAGERE